MWKLLTLFMSFADSEVAAATKPVKHTAEKLLKTTYDTHTGPQGKFYVTLYLEGGYYFVESARGKVMHKRHFRLKDNAFKCYKEQIDLNYKLMEK